MPRAKIAIGVLGALLVTTGVVVTVWGMFAGKDINSVGLASIFVAGVALVYAGIFGLMPEEIGFGDKGKIKMQAVADAVKNVKEVASSSAAAIGQDPVVLENIMSARNESEAAVAVEDAFKKLMDGMPATADVLRNVS